MRLLPWYGVGVNTLQGLHAACFRYLLGDKLSEADVRLFPTIFRFDHVYYLRFLLEKAMVVESYPNLQVCYECKHTACCCCSAWQGWFMLQLLLLWTISQLLQHCNNVMLELNSNLCASYMIVVRDAADVACSHSSLVAEVDDGFLPATWSCRCIMYWPLQEGLLWAPWHKHYTSRT